MHLLPYPDLNLPFKKLRRFASLSIFFILLLTACKSDPSAIPSGTMTQISSTQGVTTNTIKGTGVPQESTVAPDNTDTMEGQTETANSTEQTNFEPTLRPITTRTVPDDFNWKMLPIMPEISENAMDIYQYGLLLGRNPQNISVIGDCQAIPFVFLGKYGLKQYTLESADTYLEKMIEYYRASFAREGDAVRGGFTAAALLSAVRADPDNCAPGETPLECEWREQNPSIAFINLETWREEGTVDRYEIYLRKIVEFCLEHGTLPIIIMKADKAEAETHVINPAMARVAYEYDIPIINFWQAAQYLDNFGIDANREGFHLSEAGYDRKQILALRTLYQVWSQSEAASEQGETSVMASTEAAPVVESTEESIQIPVLNFQCSGSCVYFDLFNNTQSLGISELNTETQALHTISEPGISLQDVSLNQQQILINRGSHLFIVDRLLQETRILLDNLYIEGGNSAFFDLNGSAVIAIIAQDGQNQIVRYDLGNDQQENIYTGEYSPIRLMPYRPANALYWESGICPAQDFCQTDGLWFTDVENNKTTSIEGKERIVFSPEGQNTAFRDPIYADAINYYHNPVLLFEETKTGINSRRLYFFPDPGGFRVHPEVSAYVFSPDGTKIFVLFDEYSDYFEKSLALHFYMEDLTSRMVFEHGEAEGAYGSLKPQVVWSPDGNEVFLLLINTANDRDYTLEFYRKNTDDRFSELLSVIDPIPLDDYAYPHRVFWIKDGE